MLQFLPFIAQGIGKLFGGASKASAEQDEAKKRAALDFNDQLLRRYQAENDNSLGRGNLNLDRNRFELDRWNTEAQTDLDRRKYLTDAYATENAQNLDRYGRQQSAQFDLGGLDLNRNQLDLQRRQFDASESAATNKRALVAAMLGGMGAAPTTNIKGFDGPAIGGTGLSINDAMKTRLGEMAAARYQPQQYAAFQGGQLLDAPGLRELGFDGSWGGGNSAPGYSFSGGEETGRVDLTNPNGMRTGGNKFLNALALIGSGIGGVGAITNPGEPGRY